MIIHYVRMHEGSPGIRSISANLLCFGSDVAISSQQPLQHSGRTGEDQTGCNPVCPHMLILPIIIINIC